MVETPRSFAFDNETHRDPLDSAIAAAINPPDQLDRELAAWSRAEDEAFWGPRGDPGGAAIQMENGPVVILGDRRVPAAIEGGVVHVGLPGRVGYCAAWALEAVERLLRRGDVPTLVFGRAFGAQQTWAEAGETVWDLTLSEEPWNRDEYYAALHAAVGTRLPIPDRATLAALRAAISEGAWDAGWRPDNLSSEALARRRQKE